jgi:ribonuclease HII
MTDHPAVGEQARLFRMSRFERAAYARGYRQVAGVDEVGRGALAGPVVAAAVILPEGCLLSGVRDSKKLTPAQREILMPRISQVALAVGFGIVDQKDIDEINILQATLSAMEKAVESLPVKPDLLLIDALRIPSCSIPQQAIIKGDDRSLSIAAASVVAKVTRDRLMTEYHGLFPQYNFKAHKGYGTREHLEALRIHGPCTLHRRTFRPVLSHIMSGEGS